ncbi:MAG: hypothetical protein LWW77_10325 [Propionibacteriales bacterium]|nr:hypothetical protein [Propionibacteriales bacterium]
MDEIVLSTRKSVVGAWLSSLGLIPAFFAAFLVGEGLISLLGYEVGGSVRPPLPAALLATVPALLVFALPLWPVVHFARRALAGGARSVLIPVILTAVAVLAFTLMNLVPLGFN